MRPSSTLVEELAEREGFELREVALWVSKLLTDKHQAIPCGPPKPPYLPPDLPPTLRRRTAEGCAQFTLLFLN